MKRWIFAIAIAAVASIIIAGTASADVQRHQEPQTGTITVTWGGFVHVFNVAVNPDGSFTGTGTSVQFGLVLNENIVGTLTNGNLTYMATYDGTPYDPYSWSYDGTAAGGMASDSWDEHLPITVAYDLTSSTYKSHGDYVSSQGGGSDAAHSDIGKPVNSKSGK
jgi:ABC-type oligopeptide transport system substrate-binding subunit